MDLVSLGLDEWQTNWTIRTVGDGLDIGNAIRHAFSEPCRDIEGRTSPGWFRVGRITYSYAAGGRRQNLDRIVASGNDNF